MSGDGNDKVTTDNNTEQELLDTVRKQLDASEQSLSADDLRSLRLARAKAIESIHYDSREKAGRRFWSPIAGLAMAASVVALVVGLQVIQTASVDISNPKGAYTLGANTVEDLPLLGASEEFEFYDELEFYQWLEFEGHAG
ncbi:MAG: hypothetical protein PVG20_02155 [Thioalkalispiraceae bacterium]|jgi:hypothetical protein